MSEKKIDWFIVLSKIIPIPIISILTALVTIYELNEPTGSKYFSYMVNGITINIPFLIYIIILQFIVASIMYLIVKFRKVRAAKFGFYIITSTFTFFSVFSTLYTVSMLLPTPLESQYYYYIILTSLSVVLTVIFVKMMDSENHLLKYLAFTVVCILASLNLIIYVYPSIIFLLILLMPIMDVILVYHGPLGRSIQEIKKESIRRESVEHRVDSSNIIVKLTVKLDGIMLGIGDFLLYSLSAMWSIELLAGLLNSIQMIVYCILYTVIFAISFYVNIRLCLKKGYGPASPLPLIASIVLTLLSYYLLTLK